MEVANSQVEKVTASPSEKEVSVDVDLKKKIKDEPLIIRFGDSDSVDKMLKEKTDSENINQQTQGVGNNLTSSTANPNPAGIKTVASELEKMRLEEANMSEQFTIEDFSDLADLIIEVLDFFSIFLLRAFSLDTKDEPYVVPKERLTRLKRILTKILMKAQKKFPLGFLFFVGIVAVYGTPTRKAWMNRQEVLKKRAEAEKLKKDQLKLEEDKNKIKNQNQNQNQKTILSTVKSQPITKQTITQQPNQQPVQQHQQEEVTQKEEPAPEIKKTVTINPSQSIRNVQGNDKPQRNPVVIPKKTVKVPAIPRTGNKMGSPENK